LELLDKLYGKTAPSYVKSETVLNGNSSKYRIDLNSAQDTIGEIGKLDWSLENIHEVVSKKVKKLYSHTENLVNNISSEESDKLDDDNKLTFCMAMNEWKISQLWRKKFLKCIDNQ
jgi:hypothetical protein